MEPLARLPVFFALDGKRAVVAGGGAAAAWKAELLVGGRRRGRRLRAEHRATSCSTIAAIRRAAPSRIHRRAVASRRIWPAPRSRSARSRTTRRRRASPRRRARAGVPVNVIDKPAFCDFSFGAIVNRSPLVIGISTDGAAPVFGQAIRAKLEALIPRGFARWAEAARRWRAARAGARGLSFRGAPPVLAALHRASRSREPDRAPAQADFDALLARDARRGASRRGRLGHAGRRRPGRSGAADACARCARCNRPTSS